MPRTSLPRLAKKRSLGHRCAPNWLAPRVETVETAASPHTATQTTGKRSRSASELYFGDLASGAGACGSSSPVLAGDCSNFSWLTKVQVADSVSLGAVNFDLTVRDAESNSITLTFGLAPLNSSAP